MKLSKQSLMNALILATEKTASLMFAGAQNALQDGTLEIEGYVRKDHFRDAAKMVDEWVKFDPNDPKTFPPKGKFLYFDGFGIAIGVYLQCDTENGFAHVYREITHWRPLPKPPQTEEKK